MDSPFTDDDTKLILCSMLYDKPPLVVRNPNGPDHCLFCKGQVKPHLHYHSISGSGRQGRFVYRLNPSFDYVEHTEECLYMRIKAVIDDKLKEHL